MDTILTTAMEDERVVLLGVVQEKQGVDGASPYVCKAGGRPAWFGQDEPSEVKSLVCPKCKHGLFLVAQVYAPVDSDRSLYVFGCNSPECTETPGSWRVLRDQVEATQELLPAAAAIREETSQPPAMAPTPSSGWAAGDDDSDWSDDDDDKAADDSASLGLDLESLLLQRDTALKSTATTALALAPAPVASTTKQSKPSVSTEPKGNAATVNLNAFPALPIDVINEPYEDYIRENDYSHENALLQAYIKSEEEEKSADVSDLRRILSNTKKSGGSGDSSAAGGGGSGESYERTPAQLKHFQRFQKRISRCPLQVLRYDYGGEPLWPTPVQKNKIKVPRCACGEERAFELQLTPTITYFLKVDDFAHTKLQVPTAGTATATASATTAAAVGGGMDWASVVVYSCPKSCAQSREEFVYVLPAHS